VLCKIVEMTCVFEGNRQANLIKSHKKQTGRSPAGIHMRFLWGAPALHKRRTKRVPDGDNGCDRAVSTSSCARPKAAPYRATRAPSRIAGTSPNKCLHVAADLRALLSYQFRAESRMPTVWGVYLPLYFAAS
jgi:hypothetical protein